MPDIETLAGITQTRDTKSKPNQPAFHFWLCFECLTLSIRWPSLSKPSGLTCTHSQKVKIVPEYRETESYILAKAPAVSNPLDA